MGASVLLLVTIVLVLIAAVTLLIGIFGDNLTLIFVSIGASALAAIVLAVLSQVGKRRDREAPAVTPTPLTPEPAPAPAVTPIAAAEPAVAAATSTASSLVDLPIADYDSLRVNEILPQLDELDLDQLEAVAQHEEATKNRASVLNRIDDLMDELEAAEAGVPVAAATEEIDEMDELEEIDEEELAEDIESGDIVPEAAVSGGFPIADYESLSEAQVIARLGGLDADQLEEVAEYEETHANRDRVLDAIDDRLDELEGVAPAGAPVATVKKAAKAATAKKAAVKKATGAKKAAVKKAATAVKKTATKAASKAAPATKKAAASTKKAAASTKKSATSAKKASATKKATSKTATKKAAAKKAR